jgi:hypothetical protein
VKKVASYYELAVRCPVAYCGSEPHRACCDRRGFLRADAHRARKAAARKKAAGGGGGANER